ncbi:hypothetical protein [Yinghuangia sp. YIM S10712]|uniref:hypothetical protein n=1 Tax=Yinghuangia sp. YIM S10712 TaxID=3436930 RepID=UPI003F53B7B8
MSDEIDFNPIVGAVRGALDTLQPVGTLRKYVQLAADRPGLVALGVGGIAVAPHLAAGLGVGMEAAR